MTLRGFCQVAVGSSAIAGLMVATASAQTNAVALLELEALKAKAAKGEPRLQFEVGEIYYRGDGVPQSSVKAHTWFNLAAAHFPASDRRNRDQAARVRDVVAMKMTPQEIAQAQQQAREWTPR